MTRNSEAKKEDIKNNENLLYALEKKKLTIERLKKQTDAHSRLTVQEYESQIESITMSMNAALREIGMFQDMYDGIKKNNNIKIKIDFFFK